MGLRHFRGDVGLLREAFSLIHEFGLRSAERLAHVAEFLERSVYAPHSLHALPGGVGFTLLNPPLRVGAFGSLRVLWDGQPVPATRLFVRELGQAVERPVTDITLHNPIEFRPGQRIDFRLADIPATPGHHRVRIELQSIAIPPLVWFEFSDPIAEAPTP